MKVHQKQMLAIALFALSALATGCGGWAKFYPTNPSPKPLSSRPVETVQLITAGAPQTPFVEVGILRSGHASAFDTLDDAEVMLLLRTKAAEVGCDAVLVTREDSTQFGTATYGRGYGQMSTVNKKDYRAACIMFKN